MVAKQEPPAYYVDIFSNAVIKYLYGLVLLLWCVL